MRRKRIRSVEYQLLLYKPYISQNIIYIEDLLLLQVRAFVSDTIKIQPLRDCNTFQEYVQLFHQRSIKSCVNKIAFFMTGWKLHGSLAGRKRPISCRDCRVRVCACVDHSFVNFVPVYHGEFSTTEQSEVGQNR